MRGVDVEEGAHLYVFFRSWIQTAVGSLPIMESRSDESRNEYLFQLLVSSACLQRPK